MNTIYHLSRFWVIAIVLCLLANLGHAQVRNWTLKNGRTVPAEMIDLDAKGILSLRANGRVAKMPLSDVSLIDRKFALRGRSGRAVVRVNRYREGSLTGFGSGFMVGNGRYLLTNYHVVSGGDKITIETRDEKELDVLGCRYVDQARDVCLLVLTKDSGLPYLSVADGPPEVGAPVWTIGHPRGFRDTTSWGECNAHQTMERMPKEVSRQVPAPPDTRYVQTDAVILHGSSGSPLMNEFGQVIGINTLLIQNRIGLAVDVREWWPRIKSMKRNTPMLKFPLPPSELEDPMAWFSPEIDKIETELRAEEKRINEENRALPLPEREALLQEVYKDGLAKYQGLLQRRDIDRWTRLQALYFTVQVYFDTKGEDERIMDNAVAYLVKYHKDSNWLGRIAYGLCDGTEDLRHYLLDKLTRQPMSKDNQKFVMLSMVMNCLSRIDASSMDATIDAGSAREKYEDNLEALKKLSRNEIIRAGLDPEEVKDPVLAILELAMASRKAGKKANEIVGRDVEGKTIRLSDYRGKVTILDFGAYWCPYCRQMYAIEKNLMARMKGRPFGILSINGDDKAVLRANTDAKVIDWPAIHDGRRGPISRAWKIDSFPRVYILDHKGVIRKEFRGRPPAGEVERIVEALVEQAEKAGK